MNRHTDCAAVRSGVPSDGIYTRRMRLPASALPQVRGCSRAGFACRGCFVAPERPNETPRFSSFFATGLASTEHTAQYGRTTNRPGQSPSRRGRTRLCYGQPHDAYP